MTPRALVAIVTVLFSVSLVSGFASAQAQDEPTGEQDEVVDVEDNRTVLDQTDDTNGNGSDIDIRSPFDDEFGEQPRPSDDDVNEADGGDANRTEEDTPMVSLPLVVVALGLVVWLVRRHD